MSVRRSEITAFLRSYAVSLSEGDLKGISFAWHMPSLVIDQKGSLAVSKARQVEDFFGQAAAAYHESGIAAVKLETLEVSKLSGNMATATVAWRQVRSDGKKGAADLPFYVISRREQSDRLGIDLASQVGGA
jgi:hypothetical protein